jgi:hypothetical protein
MTDSLAEEGVTSKVLCHQNALLMAAIDAGAIGDAEKLLKKCGESASAVVNVPCGRLLITALQLAAARGKYENV